MRIIRFLSEDRTEKLAAVTDENLVYELPFDNFLDFINHANRKHVTPVAMVQSIIEYSLPLNSNLEELELIIPIEAQEVWAAGVTYEQSKEGRNYESTSGNLETATIYDRVYDAKRPEIFFKSTKERTVGPGGTVYLRNDSNWQIPEPELGLVVDNRGKVLGYTVGNDMSCRDIEGENPLYLPQAKIWRNSCSIGPAIRLAETVQNPYEFKIVCRIYRNEVKVFEKSANTNQLKRTYEELCSYLIQDNILFNGTILLTGTTIIPPNDFTLQNGDRIEIEIPGIGTLINFVKKQDNQSLPLESIHERK